MRAACLAWIKLAGDPVVQRILLIDAPSVIGWQRWREHDERHALGLIREVVQSGAESGRVPVAMVDTFAHVILALVDDGARRMTGGTPHPRPLSRARERGRG